MQDTVLTMNHISKSYGSTQVLTDIDMEIPRGAIYGLVGSNGAGKSTLMRIISGQTQCSSGAFSLFGETVDNNHPKVRHRIGTLIENPGFIHHMTAAQNLEYFRIQFGVPGKERVAELLDLVGLSHAGKKKYKNFSLGMKQRLGLALALLHSPEFLILGMPDSGSVILYLRALLGAYPLCLAFYAMVFCFLLNLGGGWGGVLASLGATYGLPYLFLFLGQKFPLLQIPAYYNPINMMKAQWTDSAAFFYWDTSSGMGLCYLTAAVYFILFTAIGLYWFKKREIR